MNATRREDLPPGYGAIEALPAHLTGQLIDGELHTLPRPALAHGYTALALAGDLRAKGVGMPGGGWWIVVEPELHLDGDVLVPDLAGWRVETLPEFPLTPACSTAPDWVCEILSPRTQLLDRGPKLAAYLRHGVPAAWLVDPTMQTVEHFEAATAEWMYLGLSAGEEPAPTAPFGDLGIAMGAWWAPGTGKAD